MTDTYDLKDIVRKIALLRNKAERSSTPEEAAAFAAKVSEMLLKYNLDEVALDSFNPDDLSAFVNDDGIPIGGRWRPLLLVSVAQASFVELIVSWKRDAKGNKFYRMIGRAENVAVAKDTFNWLLDEIMRMGSAAAKAQRISVGRTAWINAFHNGAAEVIARRLDQQRREAEQASRNNNTGLIIVNDQTKAAVAKFYPQLGKGKSIGGKQRYGDAYQQGRAAGASANLNRRSNIGGSQGRIA